MKSGKKSKEEDFALVKRGRQTTKKFLSQQMS
jgi:hypothetical protein